MANIENLPQKLKPVISRMIDDVDRLSTQVTSGKMSAVEWQAEMQMLISRYAQEATTAGADMPDIAQLQAQTERWKTLQFAYLDNFKNDIEENGFLSIYRSRSQMYATALVGPYSNGDVFRQAGRVLPLPAMPAEGTICHSNCGCSWEIVTVNAEGGDYDGHWKLGKTDNCQTCVQRAADWAPIQIRGGELV